MANAATERVREQLMVVLGGAGRALTTSQLQQRMGSLVPEAQLYNESVYRNLLVLERRRKVRRRRQRGRHVAWELRAAGPVDAPACTVHTTHRRGCDGNPCTAPVLEQ